MNVWRIFQVRQGAGPSLECFWTAALRNSQTKTKHGQKAGGILEGGLQQAAQMYDSSVASLSSRINTSPPRFTGVTGCDLWGPRNVDHTYNLNSKLKLKFSLIRVHSPRVGVQFVTLKFSSGHCVCVWEVQRSSQECRSCWPNAQCTLSVPLSSNQTQLAPGDRPVPHVSHSHWGGRNDTGHWWNKIRVHRGEGRGDAMKSAKDNQITEELNENDYFSV